MASEGVPSPESANDLGELQTLGKYALQKKIGAGGMGTVYLAIDQNQKRTVAIKVLPPEKASDPVLVKRFRAEGQTGAHMEHPNIVSVYESGEISGHLYIAMEYVDGKDAYELLRKRGVLPPRRSLEIIRQATIALQHAYERQVVHRDIKPSNLMIREVDGVVKLADMGLARMMEEDFDSRITRAGTTVGTVDYMSPEQARDSKAADIRSDIYSLGCTWYHLLTGRPPFPEGDMVNKLRAHAFQPVPDPRILNEGVPEGLSAVMRRMMAKKPEDRYQTPAELLVDLGSPTLLRSDFSADHLLKLGTQAASEAEDSPYPAPPGAGTLLKPEAAEARRAGAMDRLIPQDQAATAEVISSPATVPRRGRSTSIEELPPRNAQRLEPVTEFPTRKAKPERVLPGRIDRPELLPDAPSRSGNSQIIKLAGLVLGVVAVVALIVSQFPGESGVQPADQNPYQQATGGDGNAFDPQNTVAHDANPKPPETPEPTPVDLHPGPMTVSKIPVPVNDPMAAGVDQTPFAGVIPVPGPGGGELPGWVWAARRTAVAGENVIVVRRAAPLAGEFATLESALAAAGSDSVIEFADVGPHEVGHIQTWPARLVLRGPAVSGAILHWSSQAGSSPLTVAQGAISLERVHLVFDADWNQPGLIVQKGQLALRSGTLTNRSLGESPAILAEAGARCLLEDVLLRTASQAPVIELRGAQSCVAIGNGLLLSQGPLVQVESQDATQDNRTVTWVKSTGLSVRGMVHCMHHGKSPPTIGLTMIQSRLIHLPQNSEPAAAISFQGWQRLPEAQGLVLPAQVQWKADRTTLVGWPRWAALQVEGRPDPVYVESDEQWNQFWQSLPAPRSLVDPMCDFRSLGSNIVELDPAQIRTALAPLDSVLGAELSNGATLPSIPVPSHSLLQHLQAFASAPQLPTSLESPHAGREIRFDLKKGAQFNRFLNSSECPDGSTVVAFGSGLRTIEPVLVRQKRVQVIFEQSDETPLTLQPGFETEPNAKRPPAWFDVEDGQLTLRNGNFRMPTSTSRVYPERFLRMSGGLAAIIHSRVEAQDGTTAAIECIPSQGHAPPQLLVDLSVITGGRHLIQLAAEETLLNIRRSILAAPAGAVIRIGSGSSGSTVFMDRCTLFSGQASLWVEPPGMAAVQMLSRCTVFHGTAVMNLETDSSLVHWWGDENGYSQSIKTYLQLRGVAAAQVFETDWAAGWGPGHELHALSGPSETVLPTSPTVLNELAASHFALVPECRAALQEIGAPTESVGPVPVVFQSTVPPIPVGPGRKPVPGKPGNPGF
ncbi:MAG: serine/threonine protein kinase [Planctomycetota bacterium]|nr:MAG: serine/threonine protein kinase [Planctomycetota bacterium]